MSVTRIMKRSAVCFILFALFFCSTEFVFADQITFKNGDRITGKIVKKDGDKIVIETESAGTITILWAAVETVTADRPLNIELTNGRSIKGTVATIDEKIEVETKDDGKIVVEKAKISVARNNAEQSKFIAERDRKMNRRIGELWTGSGNIGLSLARGNSETQSFTAGVRGVRETVMDKISVYANAVQSSSVKNGVNITTAKALWFGGRYDYNLNRKTFVYGSSDFEMDAPQRLNLRAVLGGGFGYLAIKNDRTRLDVFGGGAFNREYFKARNNRSSAEAVIGNELKHKLNSRVNFSQRFVAYPNISVFGRYRLQLDASLLTDINRWLGWHFTIADRFNSAPVTGAEKNDLLLSTGLRVNFGKKK